MFYSCYYSPTKPFVTIEESPNTFYYFIFSAFLSFHLLIKLTKYLATITLLLSITTTLFPSQNLSKSSMYGASALLLLSFIILNLWISSDPDLNAFSSMRSTTNLKSSVDSSRNLSYSAISSFLKASVFSSITSHFVSMILALRPYSIRSCLIAHSRLCWARKLCLTSVVKRS